MNSPLPAAAISSDLSARYDPLDEHGLGRSDAEAQGRLAELVDWQQNLALLRQRAEFQQSSPGYARALAGEVLGPAIDQDGLQLRRNIIHEPTSYADIWAESRFDYGRVSIEANQYMQTRPGSHEYLAINAYGPTTDDTNVDFRITGGLDPNSTQYPRNPDYMNISKHYYGKNRIKGISMAFFNSRFSSISIYNDEGKLDSYNHQTIHELSPEQKAYIQEQLGVSIDDLMAGEIDIAATMQESTKGFLDEEVSVQDLKLRLKYKETSEQSGISV